MQDMTEKRRRASKFNMSKWLGHVNIEQGDYVLLHQLMQCINFQPIFQAEPYIAIHKDGLLFKVQHLSDNTAVWHHINGLKPCKGTPTLTNMPYRLERH